MNHPLTEVASAASFADLGVPEDLIGVLDGVGITEPFPIQRLVIPDAIAGRDVLGQAQTGSGKTVAFGVPLVECSGKGAPGRPRSLVLVPTRELCVQVADEIAMLGSQAWGACAARIFTLRRIKEDKISTPLV